MLACCPAPARYAPAPSSVVIVRIQPRPRIHPSTLAFSPHTKVTPNWNKERQALAAHSSPARGLLPDLAPTDVRACADTRPRFFRWPGLTWPHEHSATRLTDLASVLALPCLASTSTSTSTGSEPFALRQRVVGVRSDHHVASRSVADPSINQSTEPSITGTRRRSARESRTRSSSRSLSRVPPWLHPLDLITLIDSVVGIERSSSTDVPFHDAPLRIAST